MTQRTRKSTFNVEASTISGPAANKTAAVETAVNTRFVSWRLSFFVSVIPKVSKLSMILFFRCADLQTRHLFMKRNSKRFSIRSVYSVVLAVLIVTSVMGNDEQKKRKNSDSASIRNSTPAEVNGAKPANTAKQSNAAQDVDDLKPPNSHHAFSHLQDKYQTAEFDFTYAGAVIGLEPVTKAQIWIPIASNHTEQTVVSRTVNAPAEYKMHKESQFGNQILFFDATANADGEIPFSITYRIQRKSVQRNHGEAHTAEEPEKFLQGSTLVPIDQNLSQTVLDGIKLEANRMIAAKQIYDAVNRRMRYDKPVGQPWGRGDSVWACDNRFGNCTDFHSLFITLCREHKIAAKFEIGFPVSLTQREGEIGGYHCWAKFIANHRWNSVDISEANKAPERTDFFFGNLPPDRIVLSVGRDLNLSPQQKAAPVNFLVYPYVEVEGVPHSEFRKEFRFDNLRIQ